MSSSGLTSLRSAAIRILVSSTNPRMADSMAPDEHQWRPGHRARSPHPLPRLIHAFSNPRLPPKSSVLSSEAPSRPQWDGYPARSRFPRLLALWLVQHGDRVQVQPPSHGLSCPPSYRLSSAHSKLRLRPAS